MFTNEIYSEYFHEIYLKKKKKLKLLCFLSEQILDDAVGKVLARFLEQDIRHVLLLEELLASVAPQERSEAYSAEDTTEESSLLLLEDIKRILQNKKAQEPRFSPWYMREER
ncbi:MAG: hypothetical protein AB7S78_01585 [Candidatus Omnitrophota bacterium]